MNESLGVQLELPPEAAQQLRRRRPRPTVVELHPTLPEQGADLPSSRLEPSRNDDDDDGPTEYVEGLPEPGSDVSEKSQPNHDDDDDDDDVSTVVSLSPPPSRPLVLVDTERLIGYRPSTKHEFQMLQSQVKMALWGITTSADDNERAVAPPDAESRVGDMMESGVGRHMDTAQAALEGLCQADGGHGLVERSAWPEAWTHWTVVEYPAYMGWNTTNDDENPDSSNHVVVLSTRRLWKSLYIQTSIPVVDHLLQLVRDCSRPLGWKARMASAIRHLARTEATAKRQRQQARALEQWRTTQRPQELEKLYTVLETLKHKVDMERARLRTLKDERDAQVAVRLRQARLATGQTVGLEGLDFDTTNSVLLPEEPLVLLNDDINLAPSADKDNIWDVLQGGTSSLKDEAESEWKEDIDDDDSYLGEDEGEPDGKEALKRSKAPTVGADDGSDEIAERHKAEEAAYWEKLAKAKTQEHAMQEACTTNELRTAEAIVKALEERLEKTDALVETLQDEQWAEEEEDEQQDEAVTHVEFQDESKDASTSEHQLSLLDQILAMVLHAFPVPVAGNDHEHRLWKQVEHETVVMDWKAHFGRIPPGAALEGVSAKWKPSKYVKSPTQQSTEHLKESLGIMDNEEDEWDCDDSDWDEVETGAPSLGTSAPADLRVTGLRPGGRFA